MKYISIYYILYSIKPEPNTRYVDEFRLTCGIDSVRLEGGVIICTFIFLLIYLLVRSKGFLIVEGLWFSAELIARTGLLNRSYHTTSVVSYGTGN